MTFSRRSTEYVFGIILKMSVFFIVAHIHDLAINTKQVMFQQHKPCAACCLGAIDETAA